MRPPIHLKTILIAGVVLQLVKQPLGLLAVLASSVIRCVGYG